MKRMSSTRRPVLNALAMVALVAVAVVLAACGARQTASAEPSSVATTAASGASSPPVSSSRLPAVIHRGANLPAPGQSQAVPLVIALHGNLATPTGFEGATGFDQFADQDGFVVAYLDSPQPFWKDPSNYTYISSMITQLTASENIDPARVYIVGFSLGGYAAYTSACDLSSQIAAIAVVSQVMVPLWHKACNITRPISELAILGSNDAVPIHPTSGINISADQTAMDWRTLDGCSSQSQADQVGPTTQTLWTNCVGGSAVGEYVVQGGIHTWPGSPGRTGADALYNATAAIMAFFESHPASTVVYPNPPTRPNPPTPPSSGKHPSAKALTAKFLSVSVRGNAKKRSLHIMLKLSVATQTLATLSAHKRKVTSKRYKLRRGNRISLVLNLPRNIASGRYSLKLALKDTVGSQKLTIQRQLHI